MRRRQNSFKSLRHFTRDGRWSSVCAGVAESNFNAFAVFLSATAGEISFLASSQALSGCWLQLWSERLLEWFGSRKRLVLACVGAQSTVLILMVACAAAHWGVWPFLVLAVAFSAIGDLSGPAWNSWISDLLPQRRRGACFAVRNRATYPANFLAIVAGGLILEKMGAITGGEIAFCVIFAIGLSAKVLSLHHLVQQQEFTLAPPTALRHRAAGPVQMLRGALRDRESRKMLLFFAAMAFAINIGGPLQTPYVLRDLHLNYIQFTLLVAMLAAARFLAAPFVGRAIDRAGSRTLLVVSAAAMPLIPTFWALSHSFYGLLAAQFAAGIVWAVFENSAFSFIVETSRSQMRPRLFAAKQITSNLAAFAGAALGGVIVFHGHIGPILAFWVSAGMRGLAALLALQLPGETAMGVELPEAEPAQDAQAA